MFSFLLILIHQLGFDDPKHYTKGPPPSFDHPLDANVTGFATRPGDLVVVATDGLFDNLELDEVCTIAAAWEEEWYGGPNEGLPLGTLAAAAAAATTAGGDSLSSSSSLSSLSSLSPEEQSEREQEAMNDLSSRLCVRSRDLSLDTKTDSPFATLAKENDILWSGGMPDDCTVVCLRVVDAATPPPTPGELMK